MKKRKGPPNFIKTKNGNLLRVSPSIMKSVLERKFVMKKRFTEEQIVYALKKAERGTPVAEVIRKMGISGETFYRWKRRYGGLGMSKLRRLKHLEEENRNLKQMVVDLNLDRHMFRELLSKKL